jgi:hypothetical protein
MSSSGSLPTKIRISDVHGNFTYVEMKELAKVYKKQIQEDTLARQKRQEELDKETERVHIEIRKEHHEK